MSLLSVDLEAEQPGYNRLFFEYLQFDYYLLRGGCALGSNMKSLLSELTLVLPTRNRPDAVERVLQFWREWPVQILILDGSDNPYRLNVVSNRGQSIRRHHALQISDRFQFAAENIHTSFACLHPDDDFHLPYATARALETLQRSNSITSLVGSGYFFDPKLRFMQSFQARRVQGSLSATSLRDHFADYSWSYVYGLHETQVLSSMLRIAGRATGTEKFNVSPHSVAAEWTFEIVGSLLSKIDIFPEPLFLKAVGNESDYLIHERLSWVQWMTSRESKDSFEDWVNQVSIELSPDVGVSPNQIQSWIHSALQVQLQLESSEKNMTPRSIQGRRSFPRRKTRIGRASDFLRPKHHPEEDSFISRPKRMIRTIHRVLYWILHTIWTCLTPNRSPGYWRIRNFYDWGDSRDMRAFFSLQHY